MFPIESETGAWRLGSQLLYAVLLLLAASWSGLAQQLPSSPAGNATPAPALKPGWDLGSAPEDGLIHLDITVTNAAGSPVAGLDKGDFTLLDGGKPAKIQTFQAFGGSGSLANPTAELILILDQANLNPTGAAEAERALIGFLRRNRGQLAQPTRVYRLTGTGLSATLEASTDGNALADQIAKKRNMGSIWETEGHQFLSGRSMQPVAFDLSLFSHLALRSIALDARRRPGRKIAVWIGYGWPATPLAHAFSMISDFSTLLREARIALYSVSAWADPKVVRDKLGYDYRSFLEGTRSEKDANSGRLSLDALAVQSGGASYGSEPATETVGGVPAEKIDRIVLNGIDRILAESANFYRLSFDPPRTEQVDEYRDLKVEIGKPGMIARSNSGYYDQPVYYDQPRISARHLAVAELEAMLEQDRGEPDGVVAAELASVELTERMSSARLMAWKSRLPGNRAWQALVGVADASAFLELPAADISAAAPPPIAEQRLELSRIVHYLSELMPKLPNFFATRTTERYEEPKHLDFETWKTARLDRSLHLEASESVTVLYRNGSEAVDAASLGKKKPKEPARQLETRGTFGTILGTVLTDAVRGRIAWDGWEKGGVEPGLAPVAVFRYSVPVSQSHYQVIHCCYPEYLGGGTFEFTPAYRGKIAFDPATGMIFRITVQPELNERLPLIRSDIAVEYGPVEAGANTYTCPVRSVSITRGRTVRPLGTWGTESQTYGPFETLLTDASFRDYHRFGSTSTMLPAVEEVPDKKN